MSRFTHEKYSASDLGNRTSTCCQIRDAKPHIRNSKLWNETHGRPLLHRSINTVTSSHASRLTQHPDARPTSSRPSRPPKQLFSIIYDIILHTCFCIIPSQSSNSQMSVEHCAKLDFKLVSTVVPTFGPFEGAPRPCWGCGERMRSCVVCAVPGLGGARLFLGESDSGVHGW